MAKELKKFPIEKIGPKLLEVLKRYGRVRDSLVSKSGLPDLKGVPLRANGKVWKIFSTYDTGFTAYDTETQHEYDPTRGRFQWQGSYKAAEEDFDYENTNNEPGLDL